MLISDIAAVVKRCDVRGLNPDINKVTNGSDGSIILIGHRRNYDVSIHVCDGSSFIVYANNKTGKKYTYYC